MTSVASVTWRSVRRVLVGVVAVALSAVLAACAAGPQSTPTASPSQGPSDTAAPGTVVMVIRHGEKPEGSQPGIDAQGNEDDSSLTAVGWQRAERLADLLDPRSGEPRTGLARPAAIYAAGANDDGEGARTRETVAPLAERLGLAVNTDYGKGDEEKLVEQVTAEPGPTLICWAHGELPTIAEAFPDVTPTPPKDWPDDRFDVVWTFTKTADGWHFAQLPELVLPQDQSDVIDE
ncbi:histidine phosphatase family protein [Pseudonocardia adelaidensis]|uniref:histidine phosphatase family protein n=1 Tax=Pseudonocardia adelaidensis TaxID=648754 RepID=UPI0031E6BFC0